MFELQYTDVVVYGYVTNEKLEGFPVSRNSLFSLQRNFIALSPPLLRGLLSLLAAKKLYATSIIA